MGSQGEKNSVEVILNLVGLSVLPFRYGVKINY